jgi:hypothetical protein
MPGVIPVDPHEEETLDNLTIGADIGDVLDVLGRNAATLSTFVTDLGVTGGC